MATPVSLLPAGEQAANTEISPEHKPFITVQVGERDFRVAPTTLTDGSAYFASMLSGRWSDGFRQTIFIDRDADLFAHVLRFLRSEVFPIFWHKDTGFDLGQYTALLAEARYFGVKKLEHWIARKQYLKAVTVTRSVKEIEGCPKDDVSSDNVQRTYYPEWRMESRYRCPRLYCHDDKPDECGRACRNAMEPGVSFYQDVRILRMVVSETSYDVSHKVCGLDE